MTLRGSGIYLIRNVINNKLYIGSAKNLYMRRQYHFSALRKGRHDNQRLQNAFNKYGEYAFSFCAIERVYDVNKLIEREQYWIDTLGVCEWGYNISPTACSQLGFKFSKESRLKQSMRQKGRRHSEETKLKMSKSWKQRGKLPPVTETYRQKRREIQLQLAASLSPEERRKLWASNTGKKFTDEHRRKISEALKGRTLSAVHCEKVSKSKKGSHWGSHSAETIAKMSLARKKYWDKRRSVQR